MWKWSWHILKYYLEWADKKCEMLQSGQPVSKMKFEHGVTQIQSSIANQL
jgi:hypothetical protein